MKIFNAKDAAKYFRKTKRISIKNQLIDWKALFRVVYGRLAIASLVVISFDNIVA